ASRAGRSSAADLGRPERRARGIPDRGPDHAPGRAALRLHAAGAARAAGLQRRRARALVRDRLPAGPLCGTAADPVGPHHDLHRPRARRGHDRARRMTDRQSTLLRALLAGACFVIIVAGLKIAAPIVNLVLLGLLVAQSLSNVPMWLMKKG